MKRFICFFTALSALAFCMATLHAQDKLSLKVLSMNIKEGGKYASYKIAPFAEVIKENAPDVVALQEVHNNTSLNGNVWWTAELARETGMFPYFCKSFDYNGGGFGVALLTRYPFFKAQYIVSVMEGAKEPRATGWVYMGLPDGNVVRVGSVHLAVESECIISNMADVNKNILAEDTVTPTLLIGDFNAQPGSDQIIYFTRKWQDVSSEIGPTIPSDNPTTKLDYIMGYPKGNWSLDSYQVIAREDMSDHCFILAEVSFKTE